MDKYDNSEKGSDEVRLACTEWLDHDEKLKNAPAAETKEKLEACEAFIRDFYPYKVQAVHNGKVVGEGVFGSREAARQQIHRIKTLHPQVQAVARDVRNTWRIRRNRIREFLDNLDKPVEIVVAPVLKLTVVKPMMTSGVTVEHMLWSGDRAALEKVVAEMQAKHGVGRDFHISENGTGSYRITENPQDVRRMVDDDSSFGVYPNFDKAAMD